MEADLGIDMVMEEEPRGEAPAAPAAPIGEPTPVADAPVMPPEVNTEPEEVTNVPTRADASEPAAATLAEGHSGPVEVVTDEKDAVPTTVTAPEEPTATSGPPITSRIVDDYGAEPTNNLEITPTAPPEGTGIPQEYLRGELPIRDGELPYVADEGEEGNFALIYPRGDTDFLSYGEGSIGIEPHKTFSEQYLDTMLSIESQNNIINRLKDDIKEKCKRGVNTMCEQNEIHNLNVCVQKENVKLQSLLQEALSIQEKDPNRKWPSIQMATTYIEDCMPINLNLFATLEECGNLDPYPPQYKDFDDTRSHDRSPKMKRFPAYDDVFSGLDLKQRKGYQIKPRSQDPLFRNLRPENRRGHSLNPKDRIRPHYVSHEKRNSMKTSQDDDKPDTVIDCIQKKIERIQRELSSLDHHPFSCESSSNKKQQRSYTSESEGNLEEICTKKLSNAIGKIQTALKCLKTDAQEFIRSNRRSSSDAAKQSRSESDDSGANDLRSKYCELLHEFGRKEKEVAKLKATVDSLSVKSSKEYDNSNPEVRILRTQLDECKKDRDDFKVLVCEQARQIDDYRTKYMAALQKVEEQKYLLQRMELDNKRIEDQINLEIQRIKDQFQAKLNEYAHLPKLLENEQIKLADCCRTRDQLEIKLKIVCREFKAMKQTKNQNLLNNNGDPEKCKRLENELSHLKPQYDLLKECNDRLCEKYDQTRNELDMLRTESAKIIVRLKERAEVNQAALQKLIDRLEKDLAKCRATACLSIADREGVIKDMQSQLNCLSLSFDSSQKQIKSLKDHISYLSNGKTNSVVICCQTGAK